MPPDPRKSQNQDITQRSYLACGRGLGINRTPSDTLPHDQIKRQTVCVIHIIISGQSPKNRLVQQANQ